MVLLSFPQGKKYFVFSLQCVSCVFDGGIRKQSLFWRSDSPVYENALIRKLKEELEMYFLLLRSLKLDILNVFRIED